MPLYSCGLAYALTPCQWGILVQGIAGTTGAAVLALLTVYGRRWPRAEMILFRPIAAGLLAWSSSLGLAWWAIFPTVRRNIPWETAYLDGFLLFAITTSIWVGVYALLLACFVRLLWRDSEMRWCRHFIVLLLWNVAWAVPIYFLTCNMSLVTRVKPDASLGESLDGWLVYYIDRAGVAQVFDLHAGRREPAATGQIMQGVVDGGVGKRKGETIIRFVDRLSGASDEVSLPSGTTCLDSGGDNLRAIDWRSPHAVHLHDVGVGYPVGIAVRKRGTRWRTLGMDTLFLCSPKHGAANWSASWITIIPGEYVVVQIGRGPQSSILLLSLDPLRYRMLDIGQTPIVAHREVIP